MLQVSNFLTRVTSLVWWLVTPDPFSVMEGWVLDFPLLTGFGDQVAWQMGRRLIIMLGLVVRLAVWCGFTATVDTVLFPVWWLHIPTLSLWIGILSQAENLLRFPRFQWELHNYRRMTGALPQIGVKTAHLHADGRLPSARLKCPLDGELWVRGYELRWSADFCWRCSAGVPGYSGGAVVPLQSLCLLLFNWSLQFYPSSFGTIEFVFRVDPWLPPLSLCVSEFSSNTSEYLHVTANIIYHWLAHHMALSKAKNPKCIYTLSNIQQKYDTMNASDTGA